MVEPTRREDAPIYILRGGAYLLDEHAGVLIDSTGNFAAKTRGDPRSLAILLRAIADDIDDEQGGSTPAPSHHEALAAYLDWLPLHITHVPVSDIRARMNGVP